ncbi:hydrogenase maturation factor HypE [Kibdelosporangium phytohabitans]|nr:hydrogenase maturation factor HypE [Kibdelosporangium phytohabitans]
MGAIAANTWTHLAVTYDTTTIRLHVNGVQVSSVASTGTLAVSGNPLRLGGNLIWGEYFSGLADDVRVYNRVLTTAEVASGRATRVS